MVWIERVLHVSPDSGNGTVEFVIYLIAVTLLAALLRRRLRTGQHKTHCQRNRR